MIVHIVTYERSTLGNSESMPDSLGTTAEPLARLLKGHRTYYLLSRAPAVRGPVTGNHTREKGGKVRAVS